MSSYDFLGIPMNLTATGPSRQATGPPRSGAGVAIGMLRGYHNVSWRSQRFKNSIEKAIN